MDPFTRINLQQLAEAGGDPAISVYLPTYRAGREVRQNAIRFKNLLRTCRQRLADCGVEDDAADELLAAPEKLAADVDWWQHQSDGLAMFVNSERCDYFRAPLSFDEVVVVGPRFYLRPVSRILEGDGRFYILAVSQNDVRLLEGSHYSVDELEVESLPSDLRSALNIDEYVSALQQHSAGPPLQAGSTMFHGHGGSDMDVRKKDEIAQFFRRVNTALERYFGDERAPLVFAGVDYLFPLFRDSCKYRSLVKTPVAGNPDALSARELHDKAWAVVAPQFAKDREQAIAEFGNGKPDRAAADMELIVRAARQGAVDTLLLDRDQQQWGVVDPSTHRVTLSQKEAPGAVELLNDAAVHTLAGSGQVFSLQSDQLPGDGPVAAVLRYPVAEMSA